MPTAWAVRRWARTVTRYLTRMPDPTRKTPRPDSPARPAPAWERIAPELRESITRGRAALADTSKSNTRPENMGLDRKPDTMQAEAGQGQVWTASDQDPRHENSAAARLIVLLWHSDADVRQCAARALCGGDSVQAHTGEYGHFVSAFGRGLLDASAPGAAVMPPTASARYECVAQTLRALLDQNIGEIRGLSNMNYSFLSSALYLAVLATCRDTVCAIERLRAAEAQAELCRLLWNLSQIGVLRCFNGQDLDLLAGAAGRALAALPPDALADFWHSLTYAGLPRRLAVAPALLYFNDTRAVPYLLDALNAPDASDTVTGRIAACLGRLEDARALPALHIVAQSRDRVLREQARTSIAAIERAGRGQPQRTLLRPAATNPTCDSETMLRSAPVNQHEAEPARQLLRQACPPVSNPGGAKPDKEATPEADFRYTKP